MIDILKNMFNRNAKGIAKSLETALYSKFPGAINIEWNTNEEYREAIFYCKEVEYIAKFSKEGDLLEYKKNLSLRDVPESIQKKCLEYGEIMSAISIYSGYEIIYELIIRNNFMTRFVILFDKNANLLEKKQL
jgi:hypothetical protein